MVIRKMVRAISLLCCLVAVSFAHAQSMDSLENLALAEPYSEPYAGQQLWMVREYQSIPQYLSAVRINRCWGVTAGHAFLSSGYQFDNHVVGTGSNYMTDPGRTRVVDEYHMHPTWEAGNGFWDGERVDLAVVRFDRALPGRDLEIGALSLNEVFEYAGYARPATPDLGNLPYDGARRAWDAKVEDWGGGYLHGDISDDYARSRFERGMLPLGGVGTGGGSGSGGFNAAGQLVAILNFQVGSPNYMGTSYGLRLDLYRDWIESYTDDLSCPGPYISQRALKTHVLSASPLCREGDDC